MVTYNLPRLVTPVPSGRASGLDIGRLLLGRKLARIELILEILVQHESMSAEIGASCKNEFSRTSIW